MNINTIWDYSKTRFGLLINLKTNKTNNSEIKSLSGYDAIRKQLDENNTLTVKQPVVANDKSNSKVSIGLTKLSCCISYKCLLTKNYGALSSKGLHWV